MRHGITTFCIVHALRRPELVEAFAAKDATVYAMERVPRTTVAQKCDALSSMANLAGQRAVLEAASVLHGDAKNFTEHVVKGLVDDTSQ